MKKKWIGVWGMILMGVSVHSYAKTEKEEPTIKVVVQSLKTGQFEEKRMTQKEWGEFIKKNDPMKDNIEFLVKGMETLGPEVTPPKTLKSKK